jgi:aminopeptidase N
MFDEISYQKGGRIIHMLRNTVGDAAFFKALNLYLTRYAYKSAEIHDLRLVFEEVTGTDMNWFFNQWFLSSGHPVLNIQNTFDPERKEVSVTIRQNQDLSKTPLYRIPIAIDIYFNGKVERKEIVLDKQKQSFVFPVATLPDLVNVDAEKYILAEKSEGKNLQQNVFQYEHAPLFMDRLEAVIMFLQKKEESLAKRMLIEAFKDKSWVIRNTALMVLEYLSNEERTSVYGKIKELALKDDHSQVRASAVQILGKYYRSMDNRTVFAITANDKSLAVKKATNDALQK